MTSPQALHTEQNDGSDGIPRDIMETARRVHNVVLYSSSWFLEEARVLAIANAILAERERCAMIAESRKPLYQPSGALACMEVASSIRNRSPSPPKEEA